MSFQYPFRLLLLLFLTNSVVACTNSEQSTTAATVKAFYEAYNQRDDFEGFLDFYDEQIVFEDIINGDKIIGKKALSQFFNWDHPDFHKLDKDHLVISERIIQGNQATVQGYFTPFKWGEMEVEAMHFTTILTFNDEQKIIRQTDWINYPVNLVNYNTRKNSNDWIK